MRPLRSILGWGASAPTWPFALAVALLGWNVGMNPAAPGLDSSWNAGLTMATESGLSFGREIVFSYGPLGFLQSQTVWFGDLAVLALLFSASLYVSFCLALLWALRRALPLLPAVLVAFFVVTVLPFLEQPLLLAVLVALSLLAGERSSARLLIGFAAAAATFAAFEALIKLSTGPAIMVICVLALMGARAAPALIAGFLALFFAEILVLWLATGQSLAAIPDFLTNTFQIVSGYSGAMLREVDVAPWKVTMAKIAAALLTLALVVACALAPFRDRRARISAAALMAVASFIVFKEGVVRTDAGHLSLYFSTACVLWIAIPWARAHWPALLAGAAIIVAVGIPVRPPGLETNLDAVANVRYAGEQAANLASPSRRADLVDSGRAGLQAVYRLDPGMRAALAGRTVAIEPWEAAVAWAYRLDWDPQPVFQNYSAYTTALDELNAEALSDPEGPERILRENPLLVYPEFETPDLDNRFLGWDPPAQARAVLCNFAPLRGDSRWQVLGRIPDRCGPPRLLESVAAGEGETVPVPAAGVGEVVFVRIEGVEVSGFERLTTMLVHAQGRRLTLDDGRSYRLVPETATDGLLLAGDPALAQPGPFSPLPQARTIAVDGAGDDLSYEFFAMTVRSSDAKAR